ncbi:MAG: hypothetical protein U0T81_06280 [Saprospiraceae bacterium]
MSEYYGCPDGLFGLSFRIDRTSFALILSLVIYLLLKQMPTLWSSLRLFCPSCSIRGAHPASGAGRLFILYRSVETHLPAPDAA